MNSATQESESMGGGPPPTDLKAVFRHAMDLAPEIDRAWSLALRQLAVGEEHEDLRVRWSLVMDGLTATIAAREKDLIQSGIDPKHYTWPLGATEAVSLALQPEGLEERRIQLEDAQLLALVRLVKSIGSFMSRLLGDEDEEIGAAWWESGAFSLARFNATLALTLTRELDAVDAAQRGVPVSSVETMRSRAFEALESARDALDRSDPEAALLHCVRAARSRIASLSLDGSGPPPFRSAPGASSPIPIKMLALAEELLQCEVSGTAVGPGASTVLAENLVPAIEQVVRNPPIEDVVALLSSWNGD